ncbi:MAG: hypothetical protein M3Z33_11195 [Actinomycetota bacterium]|nr:hypothetical protein [Actinomycetota bacterium]
MLKSCARLVGRRNSPKGPGFAGWMIPPRRPEDAAPLSMVELLSREDWDENVLQYARVYAQWWLGERPSRPSPRHYLLLPGEARAVERALGAAPSRASAGAEPD